MNMNMNKMKNRYLIQDAVATILIDVSEKRRIPTHWTLPQHSNDLARFLSALDFEWDLDRLVVLTKKTMNKTAMILTNAHKIASRVQVMNPDKETVKKLRKDLENISELLKNEQEFRVAFDFAVNVGKIAKRIG